ncbi:MAG: sugar transferase [Gammaproteobacteria bacterium]|nr:sugar transferase [Gammaproteobacteria bacterium]
MSDRSAGPTLFQAFLKRGFDIVFALGGLLILGWLIPLTALVAWVDTGKSGFFVQERVGYRGRIFNVIKIRTMRPINGMDTTVTRESDPRITVLGGIMRRMKLDELPQLINVLIGDMSFVGPRPDVPGYADKLTGRERVILNVRPGITGPATLKYRDEEMLLCKVSDPERYNAEVVFPDKVRINRAYVENYTFLGDIRYIFWTVFR